MPKSSSKTLANGLKVVVVPSRSNPFVSVQLGLRAGAWTETKPGACNLALELLNKGTSKHTEAQLAEELDTYAISLGGNGGMDDASISADCLSEHLPRAMALLGEVVLEPTFPRSEFDKVRKQAIAGLTMTAAQPAYIADRELGRRLFGAHPYSRSERGEIADLNKLTPKDLADWWKANARPDDAVLILAGDVEEAAAVKLAEQSLGSWKAPGPKPTVALPTIPTIDKSHIYLVDRPQSVQSQIRISQTALTRASPDYPTAEVVSGYFGGAFSSRLNETIRVKLGLTYGARGGISARRFAGQFSVSTFSKTDSTVEAVRASIEEIRRLRLQPPTDDELNKTRSYLLGSFARRRETPQQIAGEIWMIESAGLPADYYARLLETVEKTTRDDCINLVAKIVDPNQMVIVVVGDAAKLKPGLETIAPLTVVGRPAAK